MRKPCYKMVALISLFGGPPLERIGVNHFLPMLELSTDEHVIYIKVEPDKWQIGRTVPALQVSLEEDLR